MKDRKKVSIVIPALNEELTIGTFVDWCKQGLGDAGVDGEILIVDSSTDNTPQIAEAHGAKVLKVPKRGLGQAYIDAIPHIQGDYVIMGDCDCTYDFREIKSFVDKLDEGYEFVMGTRMKGFIEDGAMPPLHRYFGTPLTTWILNRIYGSRYSDIHCGMRAMTLEALKRINIESSSWEYASEMVLKASKLGLKICEVPIKFYKDPDGRQSHHKRAGWFSPWYAGWINLKVMFVYSPSFFLKCPGMLVFLLGAVLMYMSFNQMSVGPISLSTHAMILSAMLIVIGFSSFMISILADMIYEFRPEKLVKYKKILTYNKGVITGWLLIAIGLISLVIFVWNYVNSGFLLASISTIAILGLTILVLGTQIFTYTLIFQMLVNRNKTQRR